MKLIILFLLISGLVQAQRAFSVKDKDSNEPVQYATIWQYDKIITFSDSLGIFYIDDQDFVVGFKISAVAYKTFEERLFNNNDIIYLQRDTKIEQLDEVKVLPITKNSIKKIGKLQNGDIGVCAEKDKKASKIAKFFKNELNEKLFLQKIKLRAICTEKNRIATINIYSVGVSGQPDKILNNENIICKLKKGHYNNEVNISQLNIEFPREGLFIVVNYLFLEQNRQYGETNKNWYYYEPSIDAIISNKYIDTWNFLDKNWVKNDKYSICFQLILSN